MKNTYIFDCGNVIMRFDPYYISSPSVSKNDIDLFVSKMFDRKYWSKMDLGLITREEMCDALKKELPDRLHNAIYDVYDNWIYRMPVIEGMAELIHSLKLRGKKIYLLSNIDKNFATNSYKFECLKDFDACIFSSITKLAKPDTEVFNYLVDKYNINPQEALFIDDNIDNVNAAKKVGIDSFLFKGNTEELEEYIKRCDTYDK